MSGTAWLNSSKNEKMRLFYFTGPNHALENLKARQIKVSSFSKCNDLFELASIDLRDREIRERHRSWLSKTNKEVGLICFSERWRDPLMWGHYTSGGMGMCLVCDVDVSRIQKVEYVPRRQSFPHGQVFPNPIDQCFRSFSSTKSIQWMYEQERRFFVNLATDKLLRGKNDGISFVPFGEGIELVGIINGPRPSHGKASIENACGRKIEYFQCRPAFRDFSVVMQQSKKLWMQ